MPIEVFWDDEERPPSERRRIRTNIKGDWTYAEWFEIEPTFISMVEEQDHTVHRIIDMSQASYTLPQNFLSTQRAHQHKAPDNLGLLVVVKVNAFARQMAEIARKMGLKAFQNLVFVESVEEARAIIAETLPEPD